MAKMLPVLDTLEMAAAADCSDENYKKGVLMTVSLFSGALSGLGVKEIEALGLEFDPNIHSAIAQEPSEGEPGRVLRVVQKGYSLGDRVVRPSMVIVSQQQTAEADNIDSGNN